MPLDVLSPRPLRALKRKLFEDNEGESSSKRLCLPSLRIPVSRVNCRSDSFLMSADRPRRDSRRPQRYDDEIFLRVCSAPTELRHQPSPSSSTISGLRSPSTSLSSLRNASTPNTSFTEESRSSSRTKSPTYREDLRMNQILIEPPRSELLQDVKEYGHQVINRARESPELSDEQISATIDDLHSLRDADEDTIKSGYMSTQLFPGAAFCRGQVQVGSNIPLDIMSVPHEPMAPPLAMPKPDRHYGLESANFSNEENAKQETKVLCKYARPSTAGCWPYFTVEFKSEARGGTFWNAENQNAGSGALCVNAMEKLFFILGATHKEIDTISFSCNVNATKADIWIHYCQAAKFISCELDHFHMGRGKDVVHFRNSVRNIIEFGVEKRLPQIKELLARLALPDLKTMDKAQRIRRSHQLENDDLKRYKPALHGASRSLEVVSSQPLDAQIESTKTIRVWPTRACQDGQMGWEFVMGNEEIFLADHKWHSATKSRRSTKTNPTRNVWFFDKDVE